MNGCCSRVVLVCSQPARKEKNERGPITTTPSYCHVLLRGSTTDCARQTSLSLSPLFVSCSSHFLGEKGRDIFFYYSLSLLPLIAKQRTLQDIASLKETEIAAARNGFYLHCKVIYVAISTFRFISSLFSGANLWIPLASSPRTKGKASFGREKRAGKECWNLECMQWHFSFSLSCSLFLSLFTLLSNPSCFAGLAWCAFCCVDPWECCCWDCGTIFSPRSTRKLPPAREFNFSSIKLRLANKCTSAEFFLMF